MRLVHGDVNVYYLHDTLTPDNVRAASYGTAATSGALVPEVGDVLHDFPGWTGEEYEPITVKVVEVKSIGDGCQAYEVTTTTVISLPPIEAEQPCFKCHRTGPLVVDRWPQNFGMRNHPERFMHAMGVCPAPPD